VDAVQLLSQLWAPLVGVTLLIYTISRLIGDVETLKSKVEVLFNLFNAMKDKKDKDN